MLPAPLGTDAGDQLEALLQLDEDVSVVTTVQVVTALAFPAIASARAGTRHKKCRKERKARVALEEKGDFFRFMETLRGLVSNTIIATK
jgi:hypothetical protein